MGGVNLLERKLALYQPRGTVLGMTSSEINKLTSTCVPGSLNWSSLNEAFYGAGDDVFSKTFDCGSNHNGVYFYGSFQKIKGRVLGRLTPANVTKNQSGKVTDIEKHTNLIKERWYR